jgi:hypothetical protein
VKLHRSSIFLFAFLLSFPFLAPALDGSQSPKDTARQERTRKLAKADADEIAGLKGDQFHANILFVDSKSAIEKWVLLPSADKPGAGRMRQVAPGKTFHVAFVVTDYRYPASESMDLRGHIRVVSPQGKVVHEEAKFSEITGADPRSPSVIVMNPVMDITFESKDLPGKYTFGVTIVDHIHSSYAKAEEPIELVQGKK